MLINLPSLIGVHTLGGIWLDLDQSLVNLSDPTNVDFTNVNNGRYRFKYLVTSGSCVSCSTVTVDVCTESDFNILLNQVEYTIGDNLVAQLDVIGFDVTWEVPRGVFNISVLNLTNLTNDDSGTYTVKLVDKACGFCEYEEQFIINLCEISSGEDGNFDICIDCDVSAGLFGTQTICN